MKRPRVRIGTLMLWVVIVALAVSLVAERRRSAMLLALAQAAENLAREQAALARDQAELAIRQERAARAALASQAGQIQEKRDATQAANGTEPR